jgi:hypothetical protein
MPQKRARSQWHFFADDLADEFRVAMRSTNPKREFKDSHNGPVQAFLVAVIPLITGENPNGAAVAQYLRRLKG